MEHDYNGFCYPVTASGHNEHISLYTIPVIAVYWYGAVSNRQSFAGFPIFYLGLLSIYTGMLEVVANSI